MIRQNLSQLQNISIAMSCVTNNDLENSPSKRGGVARRSNI